MDTSTKEKIIFGISGILLVLIVLLLFLGFNSKTYVVSFNTNGGNFIEAQLVKKSKQVIKPNNPVRDGYTFEKWNYKNNEYDFSSKVSENMILEAIWKENAKPNQKYKVTFKLENDIEELEVENIENINLDTLKFENKQGYVIKWYLNDEEYDFTQELESDVTLIGKYVKTSDYTVKFNSYGGTKVNSQTVKPGSKVIEPSKVTREGYIFDGWYLNSEKYDFNTEVNKNITLVAKWHEDPSVARYTVTFNSDGGSNVSSQRVIENKTAQKPSNPTKKGYTFKEWQLNGKTYNFSLAVTKNITLNAIWEKQKEKEKYTVTFNSDGGSNISSQTVLEGEKAVKPSNPTKQGYTFKEWQLNGKTYNFNTVVSNNVELKAVWEKQKEKEKYTVTFNSDGGSNISNQTVVEGEKAVKPSNPTKQGYTFKEWQLNGKTYNFNLAVTENITLKAVWVTKTYTIKKKAIDLYSPDVQLSVYDGNKEVGFKEIRYNGKVVCTSSNPTINGNSISSIKNFDVTLNDGSIVTAKVE